MNNCLAAWTDPLNNPYPEYVNFSMDDDHVRITLREPSFIGSNGHPCNGNTALMRIPVGDFWVLWRGVMRELGKHVGAVELS